MSSHQTALPGLVPEQRALAGMKAWQPPLILALPDLDEEEAPAPAIAGQLTLGSLQEVLEPVQGEPQQLALIDEPLIFETVDPPSPRPEGRLSRRRARLRITPGQGSLF